MGVDGIDHINVYSQGKTELGRKLSNFAWTPFEIPGLGRFESVESYWYATITGVDALRSLVGYQAKKFGIRYPVIRSHPTKEELKIAYLAKLDAHPMIKEMLIQNNLPLKHYYIYGGKAMEPKQWQWTVTLWEEIKSEL